MRITYQPIKNRHTMRKSIQILGIAAMMLTPMLISCESAAQKEEKVKAAQLELDQMTKDAADKAAKEKQAEEWAIYKQEVKAKIQTNADRIAELRVKKSSSGKVMSAVYAAKIDALQTRNSDLQNKLDAYEKENSDWAQFKRDVQTELDEIGKAFDDLGDDKKK
jgi:chromosome segregation ATPase